MKKLPPFTFGLGDRFGRQGIAQLKAIVAAQEQGIAVSPVWNKSMREHTLIGTHPESLRNEADAAVKALSFAQDYFVDADHINLRTVELFVRSSDFFTMDVAENLGRPPTSEQKMSRYMDGVNRINELPQDGFMTSLDFDEDGIKRLVQSYGGAVEAAGLLFKKITELKGSNDFAVEVSMDETDQAQGPKELLAILSMLAVEEIPVQTIAPKFTGRFNKGVDYVGDVNQFREEFDQDLQVVAYAVKHFGLPQSLKLSVHSGSDKFSLYRIIKELTAKHQAGLHIKTAGTTWLEELLGLAEAGGNGLKFVKEIYTEALDHLDELIAPYATVLDMDPPSLPTAAQAKLWTSESFISMVAHEPASPHFHSSLRQFFHVSFKLAAKRGTVFTDLLEEHAEIINRRVYENLLNKHMLAVFPVVTEM